MTRIIVKNLPKHINQERFKKHFEAKGTVTDARLMFTKYIRLLTEREGVFRKFGFIGYKTQQEADVAQKYFDKTFIDTSRIQVELAIQIGARDASRPWSKYSKGSSAYSKTPEGMKEAEERQRKKQEQEEAKRKEREAFKPVETLASKLNQAKTDEKLQEFLGVVKPKSQTWANDENMAREQDTENSERVAAIPRKEDDDLYEDLPAVKAAKGSISEVEEPEESHIARDDTISDMEYLRSKMTKIDEENEESGELEEKKTEGVGHMNPERMAALEIDPSLASRPIKEQSVPEEKEPEIEAQETETIKEVTSKDPITLIGETGRLFIRNLPYSATSSDLTELFSKFGPLSEVHISLDKFTKQSKGFGFVLFLLPEHAIKAYKSLNDSIFQGRILSLSPGKEKVIEDIQPENKTYKAKKEAERRKNAMSEFSWNSLFMNADSVIEAMAAKLGVKKAEILNPEQDNMAVRVSLAETEIIQETKDYLLECGISLEPCKERSKTIIIAKNLPFTTSEAEIRDLFEKFGSLGRVVFPPTKTIALVEFIEENDAKVAFKRLAYTRFKNLPLYLEYAPMNTFNKEYSEGEAKRIKELAKGSDKKRTIEATEEQDETHVLFVKNLAFSTTLETLMAAFSPFPGFRSARIATKPDPKKAGARLSMGYGFVEFNGKENAKGCMAEMNGKVIDGHELEIKFSNNGAAKPNKTEEEGSTKIIVRNIAFEATKRDIQQLFSPYGQIKTVRLPKKLSGHRGFAFVQFLTKQEAKNAYEALFNTHLYGRHLVLEWAKDEDSVDSLREKAKKGYVQNGGSAKRAKIDLGDEDDSAFNENDFIEE